MRAARASDSLAMPCTVTSRGVRGAATRATIAAVTEWT